MLPWFSLNFGNPSSSHAPGLLAERAIGKARQEVATLIGCSKGEVYFTGGATEANNLALKGLYELGHAPRHILVSATEHKSVLETAQALKRRGAEVRSIAVDSSGVVMLPSLEELLSPGAIVSVIAANNETGTLNPIAEVAELVHTHGGTLHVDATQWVGKLSVDVRHWNVDLLSLSAHKFLGPKGVGALFVRRGLGLFPLIHGGGQERGLRGGTLNVPGLVGLGAAATLASVECQSGATSREILRDQLHASLVARVPAIELNGHPTQRLPNTLNLRFVGAPADAVLARLRSVAASTGSACTSSMPAPSHVLLAMGASAEAADESVRFSLGRSTTPGEVEEAAKDIADAVEGVRAAMSSSYQRESA